MFFDLVRRNSRRSRKENGLFFASLLISIVAFYIILSLSHQDVMLFLKEMESDAVNRLLGMIPIFYGMTLFILFFLVYFASKYQLQRRRHEFGVYLMMGMRRSKLFLMLLAEDLWSSFLSLVIGLPLALLLSELISLVTARLVGIGILGHQVTFSLEALLGTVAGFLMVKLVAYLILSSRISRSEIGRLLSPAAEGTKKEFPKKVYLSALVVGMILLAAAYGLAISGQAWTSFLVMGATLILGTAGMFLLFFGLRIVLGALVHLGRKNSRLHIFTFRQLQENVIHQSNSLAISSLLILGALCFFGFGVATSWSYGGSEEHTIDYTFVSREESSDIEKRLEELGIRDFFSEIFEMKIGFMRDGDELAEFQMGQVTALLEQQPDSDEKEILLNNLGYVDSPHVIALSGYNRLLELAGEERISLEERQAAVYMDTDFTGAERKMVMDRVLEQEPEVLMDKDSYHLTGKLQTTNLVVDRSITLSFALIISDEDFERLTGGNYSQYWDAVLAPEFLKDQSMMNAMSQVNAQLNQTDLIYESYLQNMGRQLFYVVASSYITIYLAVIFLVIANTVIGVQFLMQQQKTGRRYQTLVRLGSTYESLCDSAKKQIRWYFFLPISVAAVSSLFGVKALFAGMLPSSMKSESSGLFLIALAMICFLCVIEYFYLSAVTKVSRRHILSLMEPVWEE